MKVLKFGGTSVGSVESLRNVRRIVDAAGEPAVVVVSALGGLTDRLISTAHDCECGKGDYRQVMVSIKDRHYEIIRELVPQERQDEIRAKVDKLLYELESLYMGVTLISELPRRTLNRIVSFGERMSSIIISAVISNARHVDSLQFIKTERWKDKDIADRTEIDKKVRKYIALPLACNIVTGGFISTDKDTGEITNLGRGGSDYTAALIAATLDADLLEIWTDVDGFMTSDPRIIPEARVIPRMTFVESMELCTFGAKVIYPPTIYPVFHKNIPIQILNTHNTSAPGTLITDSAEGLPDMVRGVSMIRNVGMITIRGALAANVSEVNSRAFNAMSRAAISVLLVTQPESNGEYSICISGPDVEKAEELMKTEFAPELGNGELTSISTGKGLAVLAIVKDGIRKMNGLGARLYNTLRRTVIEVMGISDGASDTTIALVVKDELAPEALKIVHDSVIPTSIIV